MPRAKHNRNEIYNAELDSIAYLKTPTIDLIHDFNIIYPLQINYFSDFLDNNYYSIESIYNKIKLINVVPTHNNRVYIVTNLQHVPFVLFDMDEFILGKIYNELTKYNSPYENPNSRKDGSLLFPDETHTLFIFNGTDLICREDIHACLFVEFMAVFYKENQVDYSNSRYYWYGEPRRNKTFSITDL